MSSEIAVLIAAGRGERMRPITLNTPKPLVKVHGIAMIETVIDGLIHRGVKHIYVVVGYLGEQFDYLREKYNNITIVKNDEYTHKNNISSIYAVREFLGDSDCFVCEADLYISDNTVFDKQLTKSGYFGKYVAGYSSDWLFTIKGDRLIRIGKGGYDKYNMCGISFFTAVDIKAVAQAVEKKYTQVGHENLYWDEIVDELLPTIDMKVYPIKPEQIVEIDTVEELKSVDPTYEENV